MNSPPSSSKKKSKKGEIEMNEKRPQESSSSRNIDEKESAVSSTNKRKYKSDPIQKQSSPTVPVEPYDQSDKDNEYGEFEDEDNEDEDDESDLTEDEDLHLQNPKTTSSNQHRNSQLQKEKNREHAKNTRMRRKNFIESLKDQLIQLQNEQEKIDRERKVNLNRLIEQTQVRQRVLEELMRYRCVVSYIEKHVWLDRGIYMTLLEESVIYTLPVTPYRTFPPAEVRTHCNHRLYSLH